MNRKKERKEESKLPTEEIQKMLYILNYYVKMQM